MAINEAFLGRDTEQGRWRERLAEMASMPASEGQSFITIVHGIGGLGKSTLVRRLLAAELIEASGAHAVLVDLEAERERWPERFPPLEGPSVGTVLYTIERHLVEKLGSDAETAFGEFRGTLAEVLNLVTTASRAEQSEPFGLTREEQEGARAAAGLVAGLFGLSVAAPTIAASLAAGTTAARGGAWLRHRKSRKGLRPETPAISQWRLQLSLDPERALIQAFAEGVRDLTKKRSLIIAIDTAEIATSALASLQATATMTGTNTMWLFAGRFESSAEGGLEGNLGRLQREVSEERLTLLQLPVFDRALQAKYVHDALPDLPLDDGDLGRIDAITRGIPLALSLVAEMLGDGAPLAQLEASVGEEGEANVVVRRLSERFLHHALARRPADQPNPLADDLSPIFGLAVDATADAGRTIGHDVRRRIVAALVGVKPEALDDCLKTISQRHDFVSPGGRVHAEVSRVFSEYLLGADQRLTYAQMNLRASAVVREAMGARGNTRSLSERHQSEAWRSLATLLLRHEFWASNELGLASLLDLFPSAVALSPDLAIAAMQIAARFYPTASAEEQAILRGLMKWTAPRSLDRWLARRTASEGSRGIPDGSDEDVERARAALALRQAEGVFEASNDERVGFIALLDAVLMEFEGADPTPFLAIAVSHLTFDGLVEPAVTRRITAAYSQARAATPARLAVLDQAVAKSPNNVSLRRERGAARVALAQFETALEDWEFVAQTSADRVLALQWQAFVLSACHRYDEALAAAQEAVGLAPDDAGVRARLAFRLGDVERWDEALEEAERAVANGPLVPEALRARAYARAHFGDPAHLADRRRVCELDETSHSFGVLADAHFDLGEIEEARLALEKAVALGEATVVMRFLLGAIAYVAGDNANASRYWDAVRAKSSPFSDVAEAECVALVAAHSGDLARTTDILRVDAIGWRNHLSPQVYTFLRGRPFPGIDEVETSARAVVESLRVPRV